MGPSKLDAFAARWMAVKQPLLPWLRVRDTEVLVVELRHRRCEVRRIACELEGESIGPCLSGAGPPQLERPERERNEAEHRRQERKPGHVAWAASDSKRARRFGSARGRKR